MREYFEKWVKDKRPETKNSTYVFYRAKARAFLDWLGQRADEQITLIDRDDIKKFREFEMKRVSWRTTRHGIKFLRMVFKSAKEDGKFHEENPATGVKVAEQDGVRRRGFKIPEIRRILEAADDEWKSLVYLGLYTGQRLGDLTRLTWANVDLDRDEIRFVTAKTSRQQIIPIAPPLRKQIEKLPAGDDPRQPLHPREFASVQKSGAGSFTSCSPMPVWCRKRITSD